MKKSIYTIGHSTRSTREFIKILKSFDIELLIDVRHYPGSKHCPQFGKERLKNSLKRNGIEYVHLEGLGGRRRPIKGMTVNAAWRSPQFRGYADYMQSKEFFQNLKVLMKFAQHKRTVIMCAEAVPWRCHRSLIADALLVRGFEVEDLFSQSSVRLHKLTPFARVYRKKVTYPQ